MEVDDAARLIRGAFQQDTSSPLQGRCWADLGAGAGTFMLALARLLGGSATIHAIDNDPRAIATLERLRHDHPSDVTIVPRRADLTDAASWRALQLPKLNGALIANTLHFVPEPSQSTVLERVADGVQPGGLVVIVEYADRKPSRWVPHPVSLARLRAIIPPGLSAPREIGRRRSAYGGTMYAAVAERV